MILILFIIKMCCVLIILCNNTYMELNTLIQLLFIYVNYFFKLCLLLGIEILTYLYSWRLINKRRKYSRLRVKAIILIALYPLGQFLLRILAEALPNSSLSS